MHTTAEQRHSAHLVHIVNHGVHHLALERLVYDRSIARDELGLSTPHEYHAFADVDHVDDGDNVSELSGTGAWVRVRSW